MVALSIDCTVAVARSACTLGPRQGLSANTQDRNIASIETLREVELEVMPSSSADDSQTEELVLLGSDEVDGEFEEPHSSTLFTVCPFILGEL